MGKFSNLTGESTRGKEGITDIPPSVEAEQHNHQQHEHPTEMGILTGLALAQHISPKAQRLYIPFYYPERNVLPSPRITAMLRAERGPI